MQAEEITVFNSLSLRLSAYGTAVSPMMLKVQGSNPGPPSFYALNAGLFLPRAHYKQEHCCCYSWDLNVHVLSKLLN